MNNITKLNLPTAPLNTLLGFELETYQVPLEQLLPSKKVQDGIIGSRKYKQLVSSIQEIGLIEPLSVIQPDPTKPEFLLLDGHLRALALKTLGLDVAPCLLARDDESFTYNNRVNRLSTIQEHVMIRRAIERGVGVERLARAFNVNLNSINRRANLLDYVLAATGSIAGLVKPGDLVILESTSPVGTTRKMAEVLSQAGVDMSQVHVAYCPERVLPGKIMTELVENDRVVGGLTPEATKAVSTFYKTFVRGAVLETDAATAEMCKLTENSYRDVNIAFANELSLLCAKSGINVWQLINLANRHPRVNILQPGTGVGGHCIAVDPWFIVASDPDNARIIRTAREVNNYKTEWVIDQIKIAVADASARTGRKPKVVCLGLAFKPDIDDLRESPAVHVASALQAQSYNVVAVEPNIQSHDKFALVTLEEALQTADVVAVLVKHRQFVQLASSGELGGDSILDFCGVRE